VSTLVSIKKIKNKIKNYAEMGMEWDTGQRCLNATGNV
jgi:hypothetical protein